jgi:hypothetical protein
VTARAIAGRGTGARDRLVRSGSRPRPADVVRSAARSCSDATTALPVPKPALQVCSIHDAEYQDHTVGVDDVVHHAVVTDAHPMEGVAGPTDGLYGLAGDASGLSDVTRESLGGSPDAIAVSVA